MYHRLYSEQFPINMYHPHLKLAGYNGLQFEKQQK